jgi:hypothetical protein
MLSYPLSKFEIHLYVVWCQLCNEEISLDILWLYQSKQRGMLCQSDDLLHYSNYVGLRNLMQTGAALLWDYEAVGFHVLVDFLYKTLDAHSNSLNSLEIHRAKLLGNVRIFCNFEFLN